jgi:hypothetical protein
LPIIVAAQRAAGVVYLARTNFITTTSLGVTNGVLLNNNPNTGGSGTTANKPAILYLGQTNVFHTDCVTVGAPKSWAGTLLAFNPAIVANNPVAFFRGVSGDPSRVSIWAIGSDFPLNNSNQNAAGTHGFNAITNTCDPMDDFGHGTHAAALLLKTAPFADIHVARVASRGKVGKPEQIVAVRPIPSLPYPTPLRPSRIPEPKLKSFATRRSTGQPLLAMPPSSQCHLASTLGLTKSTTQSNLHIPKTS